MRFSTCAILIAAWGASVAAAETPKEQVDALLAKYKQEGGADQLAGEMLTIARDHHADPVALDALTWVLKTVREPTSQQQAIELILKDHRDDERLHDAFRSLVAKTSPHVETFFRQLLSKTENRRVQASAIHHLALHLQRQIETADSIQQQPRFVRRFEQFYGKEMTAKLRQLDRKQVAAEAESLHAKVVSDFGEVDPSLAEDSQVQLRELRHLSIGKPAQEIEGEDLNGEGFRLSAYRGRVVLLTFWGHW